MTAWYHMRIWSGPIAPSVPGATQGGALSGFFSVTTATRNAMVPGSLSRPLRSDEAAVS